LSKKISNFLYIILSFIDSVLLIVLNKSFLIYFSEFYEKSSYKKVKILNKNINFFTPNQLIKWRVETIFSKEPETIEWINTFEKKKNIFWDIGANIGLYSIYNSIKNKNSTTIAFEPSTNNLRVLSRNISINKLDNKIKIFTLPLTKDPLNFMRMQESSLQEGSALHSFGEKFDFEGNKFRSKINYSLLGLSINYLLKNKILQIPNYIKLDVDGIEHLILQGGNDFLNNKKIKSISVEVNENFKQQFNQVIKIMKKNNFKIRHKKHNYKLFKKSGEKFLNTFNYVFDKI
jgi:FkbM family methyltransferase